MYKRQMSKRKASLYRHHCQQTTNKFQNIPVYLILSTTL